MSLNNWLESFTSHIESNQPYREPDADEVSGLLAGLDNE